MRCPRSLDVRRYQTAHEIIRGLTRPTRCANVLARSELSLARGVGVPPVPAITLRSVRSDLAYKLEQLEVRAAVLERDTREALPFDLPPERIPLSERAISAATVVVGWGARLFRAVAVWSIGALRSPKLGFAFRVVRGCIYDAVLCVGVTGVVLLAAALAFLVMAPPD